MINVQRHSDYPKPVIGIAGGIGAGKSVVAQGLAELGCAVIDSDSVAHDAIQKPEVKTELVRWWGDGILTASGDVDRRAVGKRIFGDQVEADRLNGLLHPLVAARRDQVMKELEGDSRVKAVVWDTPLLFEVGWDRQCDAVIFVKVPYEKRLERVRVARGWDKEELARRENFQLGLDKKEKLSDYVLDNDGEVAVSLLNLRELFFQIQAKKQSSANRPR